MTENVTLRPRRREDDERLLEIYHQYDKSFIFTLAGWRYHLDERKRNAGTEPQLRVAEREGEIVGQWYLEPNTWSPDLTVFFAVVEVDREWTKRGIGTLLWDSLEKVALERSVSKLYTRTVEGEVAGERFATKMGFLKTGRAERISRLEIAKANLEGYEGLEERLREERIEIRPMSELDQDDEAFMRSLHAATQDAARDIPSSEEYKPTPYEVWRANFLKSPDMSAETYWIALLEGRPVGLANLMVPSPTAAVNGLTGVAREARGRGVARGLKLKTIQWAREHGVEHIDTGNDAENERMLAINVRLGYKPQPAHIEWLKQYLG